MRRSLYSLVTSQLILVVTTLAVFLISITALARDPDRPCGTVFPVSDYLMVREGGMEPPQKISGPNPDFSGITEPVNLGAIVLEVFIGADGEVDGVLIVRGTEPKLTRPAVKAMFDWVFEPATVNGEPVPCRYIMTVRF
jgi:hypothetical protein